MGWCLLLSAGGLIVWLIGFLMVAFAMAPIDNPAGLGLFFIAPFFLALPFGAINALVTMPILLAISRSETRTLLRCLHVGIVLTVVVCIGFWLAFQWDESLWNQLGFPWFLVVGLVPPTYGGVAGALALAED